MAKKYYHKIPKKTTSNYSNPQADVPLAFHAMMGKVTKVKEAIRNGADVNQILDSGFNILYMVIMSTKGPFTENHLKVMEVLIANGINVNLRSQIQDKTVSLLHLACARNNVQAVDMLIKNGADVDPPNCVPLLHWTIGDGNFKMTQALLKHKLIRNRIDVRGSEHDATPLHHAVGLGHNDIALLLLEHNVNVHAKDNRGSSIILTAASNASGEVIKKLLEKGADVHAKGYRGVNALKYAIINRRAEAVKVLLAHGADPNQTCIGGATALHTSVSKEAMEEDNIIGTFIFKQLIEKGAKVNVKDHENWYPLHLAAKYGKTLEVDCMLKLGAKIDPVENNGVTPLAYACQQGHFDTAKVLVKAGANVNKMTEDESGASPLHFAVLSKKIEIVRFLVRAGAKIDATDKFGRTPLKYATLESRHHAASSIIDFLLCNGAKKSTGDCCTECLVEMDYLTLDDETLKKLRNR